MYLLCRAGSETLQFSSFPVPPLYTDLQLRILCGLFGVGTRTETRLTLSDFVRLCQSLVFAAHFVAASEASATNVRQVVDIVLGVCRSMAARYFITLRRDIAENHVLISLLRRWSGRAAVEHLLQPLREVLGVAHPGASII